MRKQSFQRRAQHAGAAAHIENALDRQSDVIRMRGEERLAIGRLQFTANPGPRIEIVLLVVAVIDGHEGPVSAMDDNSNAMRTFSPRARSPTCAACRGPRTSARRYRRDSTYPGS